MLLGMFHASRRGEFATTGPALENPVGRAATPVGSILEGVATRSGRPTDNPRSPSR
jgi:hypothetical protein